MSNKIELLDRHCENYGWTPENIILTPQMFSHLCHHINNALSLIVCSNDQRAKNAGLQIRDYVKSLEAIVKENE